MRFGRSSTRLALLAAIVGGIVLIAAVHHWATQYFLEDTARRDRAALALNLEVVRGWLGRYRALAPVYARDPVMIAALSHPEDGLQIELANRKLAGWTRLSGASETYLLDTTGMAIAASNSADPISFVGQDYSYRPYYTQAMEGRLGRFFALGTSSGKRGYYFSHPVRVADRIIGVAVVKVGVEQIEADLRSRPQPVFVSDGSGVIVLAGRPDWRLTTLGPLTEADRMRIRANHQFDLAALAPVPIDGISRAAAPEGGVPVTARAAGSDGKRAEFLHLTTPMAIEGWTLHLLAETAPARTHAVIATALVAALILAAGFATAAILQRRQRLLDRLTERARSAARLERKVAERTAELRDSNLRLEGEIAERIGAEQELRRTQADLVQAGKLAALGQMSAALSHEFNQPLTAVRTYAENALAFLERGGQMQAAQNIARISTLTHRMAQLSRHLTSFARKPSGEAAPIGLAAVFDEVLGLLQGRLARAGITPELSGLEGEVMVIGGMVRLQHLFMNLLANAIDAVAGRPEPRIAIAVAVGDDTVAVTVEDNGPGIAGADLPHIFDPFFTTKEVGEGLGLGLSISYNIVRDFGGALAAANRPEGGARFTVTLRRAGSAATKLAAEAAE